MQKDQNPTERIPVPKVPSCVPGEGKIMGYLHSKAMDVHWAAYSWVNRDQLRALSQAASFAKPGQKPLLQEAVAGAVPLVAAEISGSGA